MVLMSSAAAFFSSLHLRAVLAHDVQVVAAGLAGPVGLLVELRHSAEAAKAIGGEEDFLAGLIAHHDLRPVDHGCEHESQGVAAQIQVFAVLYGHTAVFGNRLRAEELIHILEGLGVAHHFHLRVKGRQLCNVGTVVRLHVGDNKILRLAAVQCLGDVRQPLVGSTVIHGIEDGGLLVQNDIRVIADAGGDRVLALEQINGGIIHTHTENRTADMFHAHGKFLL